MLKLIAIFTAITILPVLPKNSNTSNSNSIPAKAAATPGIDKLKQSDWYTAVLNNLEQSEYSFAWQEESSSWSTPNRKNDLRFFYDENGFTVQPRTTQHSWKAAFTLDKKQIGKGVWQVKGNKAEYITDKITVQYINSDEGMRQNFIVSSPLSDDPALKIHFSIKTKLQQRLQNNCIQLTDKKNTAVLNYDQLKVWDANGTALEASFEKSNTDYCIQVNTSGAVYPVTIDPISTTPAITIQLDQASARLGISISSAGDINGDGYSDIAAGAYQYDNGQVDEGAVFIYYGSPTGITNTATLLEINQAGALMGAAVASAGDVNGDGYSDVIAGAHLYDNGQVNEGGAFIYRGSSAGIITTAIATLQADQADARFGNSVAGAGDVNGDGYSDVLAGAYFYDNGQSEEGAAFVYYGNTPGTSKRNNLKVYAINLTTPVVTDNFGAPNFGAGLFAKSFLGRSKGKLVWETRLNYNAYSGAPITNSTLFTAQQAAYTDLGLTGTELKNLIAKRAGYTRIRARVKYSPVTAITGQLYGPWRYVPVQILGNSLGTLPVKLVSFTAAWQQKGKTAQIRFVTDSESEICCYEIEKSANGVTFNKTGRVGAKNTPGRTTYNFMDNDARANKQYYRLKTIHNSGAIDYSNIQLLQTNTAIEILVFPNPATDVLQLQLNSTYANMNVQIVNQAGQMIKQYTGLSTANGLITIPVQRLATGTYFLHLQSGAEKQVLQL